MPATDQRQIDLRRGQQDWQGRFRAMASPCEVLVRCVDRSLARRLTEAVAAEAWRIEDKFSRYRPDNVVAGINSSDGESIEVDEETAKLLDFAAALYELSDGRFDITSGVLRRAWRFDGSDRVPSPETVAGILAHVGWHRLRWEKPRLRLQPGMQIDFGGIGKEYAVDSAAALARDVSRDAWLINFGGDLVAGGADEAVPPWQVGIEAPDGGERHAERIIRLSAGALATSGDARRYLLADGKRYGHILDPLTGWPVEGAPRSVTVAADTCTQAGMLATLAMLRGDGAESFLDEQGVQYWCLR